VNQQSLQPESKWLYFFIGLAVLVNFSGLFVPLMDPDAGVYASLSKNMLLRNNWLELYFQGNDWLDKPHFPFWVTAVFLKIFGIHTWSYKLPGILFVLMGAWYTYLLAKKLYNKTIALWAVFILLTAEHIIISNNDVRAEPFLTGLIIASIYHFSQSLNRKLGLHLILASFFAACAVMTKGLFTLIPVGGAIAGELIIKRNWKDLFHWRWLIAAVLTGLFITPELYSLWYQFDKHPEKTVFGKTNVSGIRFFLWDSQFGRFLNTAPMKGKGDPFFFIHTLLWAFLPWSLIMYASLIDKIRNGVKKIAFKQQEWLTLIGSLLTLFVFSLSKFQLPYYSNIIFPLLAILTAQYIWKIQGANSKTFKIIQYSIVVILFIGGILLQFFYSPVMPPIVLLIILAGVVLVLILLQRWLKIPGNLIVFYRTGLAAIALNLYINWFFYPDLLKYQSGSEAAFYMNKNFPDTRGVHSGVYAPVFEFYIADPFFQADTVVFRKPELFRPGTWYVTPDEFELIKERGIKYEIIKELDEFHVTMLSVKFINKKTRSKELRKFYLVKLLSGFD
jgi:4-amino-4-deoxy-L-arabinose transferase-like glycosyltransferase